MRRVTGLERLRANHRKILDRLARSPQITVRSIADRSATSTLIRWGVLGGVDLQSGRVVWVAAREVTRRQLQLIQRLFSGRGSPRVAEELRELDLVQDQFKLRIPECGRLVITSRNSVYSFS